MQGAHQFIYLGKIENFVKIVLLMKLPEAVLKLNKSYRNCNCCRLPQAWHPQPIARIIEEGNEVFSLTYWIFVCNSENRCWIVRTHLSPEHIGNHDDHNH